jgi:hypothetical protein
MSVEFSELRNIDIPIEKIFYGKEDTYDEIKARFKCSDNVMHKAMEYVIKKDERILEELKYIIKEEQAQIRQDANFLKLIEKKQ